MQFKKAHYITVLPARLGDSLFRTPVFRYFKHHFPQCRLDVVTQSPLGQQILTNNPYIDNVLKLSDCDSLNANNHCYDLALSVHENRPGADLFHRLRLPVLGLPSSQPTQAEAETYLNACTRLTGLPWQESGGHYDLFPGAQEQDYVDELCSRLKLSSERPLIGLHLGCHGLRKGKFRLFTSPDHPRAWPVKHFIALAKKLSHLSDAQLLITGSGQEEQLSRQLCAAVPRAISLVNKTNVLQLATLMRKLDLFICGDTGTLHVAASTPVPILALFPSAHVKRAGPYPAHPHRHKILSRTHLKTLPVEEVLAAALQMLQDTQVSTEKQEGLGIIL